VDPDACSEYEAALARVALLAAWLGRVRPQP